jgi:multiple sugar transport system substrate-binding protein
MKSGQRRRAAGTLIAALIALAMAGCVTGGNPGGDGTTGSGDTPSGDASGAPEPVTLDFPNFQAAEAPFSTWWDEFIAAYEEEYPHVTVEVSSAPNSAALAETLTTRFAAGDPPSFIQQTTANFAKFASGGYFRSLDYLLEDTNVPELWGPLQETYLWEGETQGVMSLSTAMILYYNEKLLQDAGIEEVPTTAEELIEAAEAVYDPENGIFGFVGVSAPQDTKLYNEPATFVVGQGGHFYDGDEPNFTDPTVLDGLDFYRRAMATAPPGIQHTQRNTIFQSGKGAFMIENANFTGALRSEAPADVLPYLKSAPAPFDIQAGQASVFLGIPSGIEGAELEAAENFLLLAISPEWQQRYAEIIGAPAPDPNSATTLAKDDPQMEMFAELAAKSTSVHPSSPVIMQRLPEFNKLMFDAFVSVSSSDRPIPDIMAGLQGDIEALL